ncbi:MAG TPA: EAL domain-containing protein [Noviherbaspirillum sp.]|uniref:EAL domain-containing protein n=1 Tax=Noviherbaspirillum sp. TaxID=1926288 RepID=UPI002D6920D2|nr:EAL domain-containing protein [Noviherbaspirillum sp.]HYD96016.1 EAL domain-containing protein [Noviherbaspirillum sp.]
MLRPYRPPAQVAPYLLAVSTVLAATLLRYALAPYLGERAPLLLFTLPVVACALFGGVRSSIMATILGLISGVYFFVEEPGTLLVNDPGEQVRVVLFTVIGATITVLGGLFHRSREAQHDLEERFRLLVEGVSDVAVFFVNPQGHVESWNKGAERIKGYRQEEVLGKHISLFYTDDDRRAGASEKLLKEAAAQGVAKQQAWRVRKSGEHFWADVTLTALYDVDGKLRGYSKITYDRTREHALMLSLEESEQTARALLESTTQAVVGINEDGQIRLVNKAAEEMFGYTRRDLLGKTLELLLPEQSRGRHVQQRSDYFRFARPRPMGQGMELSARRQDGSIFPIEASINMCETPAGPMAVSFITDITKRKGIENALLIERSQLKSILDYSPLLVSIKDLSGRIIIANQSFADVLGIPQNAVLGRGVFDLLPPDVAKRVWQRDQEAVRSKGPVREEELVRLKDGSSRTYATVRFPVSYINSLEPFGLCSFSLDITEQKEAEQRALHAAQHDPLTDLPNRALVYEFGNHLLASAKRSGTMCAVLFFDLDRFKPINDTYGHEIGDKMLQEVARRLTRCVRSSDLVGRLGGDEFVAILSHIDTPQDVEHSAKHLLAALREPYFIEGLELRTSPSIGISLYPTDASEIDGLIRRADAAMYHAKANGRNTFQFFNLEIDTGAKRAFALEQRLRQSFHESEFQVHYQPIVDTKTMQVTGAEALIRWQQKGAEMVMPGEFILAAEACGLINQLGAWVMHEACCQHARWRKAGLPPLRIAVNVSPLQFRAHDFDKSVADAINRSGIAPHYLELEVTESMVMRGVQRAMEQLADLKRLGLRISLDDFGTGYSSLSHLSQLPIDKLKVDQSFVRNMKTDKRAMIITETVIDLGKKLGVEVVAEGIESEEALNLLRERDCDLGQGYYFSAPLDGDRFADWYRHVHPQRLYH